MKKTLVALAALAATSAFAQSSVTAYGVIDTAYYTAKVETSAKTTKYAGLTNGTLAGPRLGFKGTEDMGNGLKANFAVEMALNFIGDGFGNKVDGAGAPAANKTTDAKLGAVYNRQTWGGLSGDFGEVRAGFQHTLQYDHNAPYSAGFEGAAGAREHLEVLSGASLSSIENAETNRVTGLTYFTPAFGAFKGAAQWGALKADQTSGTASTTAGTDYKASHSNVAGYYNQGPLSAGAVYGTSSVQGNVANTAYSGGVKIDTKTTSLGASYDLGVAKLFAYYGKRDTTDGTASHDVSVKVTRIGTQVPFGNTKLFATTGNLTGEEGGVEKSSRKTTQVGVLQSLSKRTTAYVVYGKDKADLGLAGFSATAAGAPVTVGTVANGTAAAPTSTTAFRIGLNHSF